MRKKELEALEKFLEEEKSKCSSFENIYGETFFQRTKKDFSQILNGFKLVAAADFKESDFTALQEIFKSWIKSCKQSKLNKLFEGYVTFSMENYEKLIEAIREYYFGHKEEEDG